MRPTDILRDQCTADWQAATNHPFCRELANGRLPVVKMKWYLAQDYKFIDSFVRLLATTIAHAPTLADSVPAAQFLALVTGPENTYFQRAFDALEMTEAERNPATAPATAAFLALMVAARQSGNYAEMLAVLTVAEWSYLSWAERYHPPHPDLPFWFSEWIDLHSGPGFEAVVDYLRTQLDTSWQQLESAGQQRITRIFAEAVRMERDFFDAAYAAA